MVSIHETVSKCTGCRNLHRLALLQPQTLHDTQHGLIVPSLGNSHVFGVFPASFIINHFEDT
jgi:hypothetical protein